MLEGLNGVIIVDKEKNYTSRDVVNILSKKFKTKKIGHTGTLDPMATGVLVVTIGKATKISELLTSTYKEYIATMKLGIKTDTYDIEGKILEENKINLEKEEIKKAIRFFKGKYIQEVPIYSSVKVKGKKLYEYARNNEKVNLPKKEVDIKEIEILNIKNEEVTFKVTVSKGTYIRSLINDIGSYLKCGAVMTDLRRTKQGKFSIDQAYTLKDIENENYQIVNVIDTLDLYEVEVDDNIKNKIKNGCILENRYNREIVLFKQKGQILAIYKKYTDDKIKPWKMF